MSNRADRRRQGKRQRYREAVQGVAKIIELDAKGLSPRSIAPYTDISAAGVERVLERLKGDVRESDEGGGGLT